MNNKNVFKFIAFARHAANTVSSWVDWHNAVFGMNGKFVELFPERIDREEFMDSSYVNIIDAMSQKPREEKSIKEWTTKV